MSLDPLNTQHAKILLKFSSRTFFFLVLFRRNYEFLIFHVAAASQNPPCWNEKKLEFPTGPLILISLYKYFDIIILLLKGLFIPLIHEVDPKVLPGWRIKKKC